MKTTGLIVLASLVALILPPSAAGQFRAAPSPGQDWGSVRIHAGVLSPLSTFEDDSFGESRFKRGAALGLSVLTFPFQGRLGFGVQLFRSRTDGHNEEFEFAPLAVNDPVQWIGTADLVVRHIMDSGYPYIAVGAGLKQYNWAVSRPKEDRFFAWNLAAGWEYRPRALGSFGLNAELRTFRSEFIGFGIDDGTWETGTEARPGQGFYGGVVGGQPNNDLLFTLGLSIPF